MKLYIVCKETLFLSIIIFFLSSCSGVQEVGYTHSYRKERALSPVPSAIKFLKPETQATSPLEPIKVNATERTLPIDLPSALRLALIQNLDIALAKSNTDEAEAVRDIAKLNFLPGLSAFLLNRHISGTIQGTFGDLRGTTFDTINPQGILGLSLNPGQSIYHEIASNKNLEATNFGALQIEQNILQIAAQEYFKLLASQSHINIAEKAVAQSTELLRITKTLEQQGAGLKVDVFRAEAQLQSDKQRLLLAKNEYRLASLGLTLTLKIDPVTILLPKETEVKQVTIVDTALTPDDLIAIAIAKRPEVQEAQLRVEFARSEEKAALWGAFGPGVSVEGQVGEIGTTFDNLASRTFLVGFMGWNLSGSNIGKIKLAKAQLHTQRITETIVQEQIKSIVVKAYEDVLIAREEIDTAEKELTAAENTLNLSQSRLKHGEGITLEVLQAQESLTKARTDYVEAIVKYNNAQFQLLNALGELTMEGLMETPIFRER